MSKLGAVFGRTLGWAASPAFGLASLARRARVLHPRGLTLHAAVTRHADAPGDVHALADRLAGPAFVRFSAALWKRAEGLPDVLGCAVRLHRGERDTAEPGADDQDLLFATIRRPWTMPFAPLTTDVRDYLGNDYFGVSPFDVGLGRRAYLRLRPVQPSAAPTGTRVERLLREVEVHRAALDLELAEGPYGPWTPVALVSLQGMAHVDGEALRFHPFRDGRGVRPVGFVHALRRGAYAMSQRTRPAQTRTGT